MTTSNREQTLAHLAQDIRAGHRAAAESARTAVEHAQRTGELLIEAKELVPHGQWAKWLRCETKLSQRTAQRYMQIARNAPPVAVSGIKAMADALARTRYKAVAGPMEVEPRWSHVDGIGGEQLMVPIELLRPNPHWPFGPFVDSATVDVWEERAQDYLLGRLKEHCLASLLGYCEGRSYQCLSHMPLYFGAHRLWEKGKVADVPMTAFPKSAFKAPASVFALFDLWGSINWSAGERDQVPMHMIQAVKVAAGIAHERGQDTSPETLASILPCATKEDISFACTMAQLCGERLT